MATAQPIELTETSRTPRKIEAPAPTSWPLVLASGFTLIFAGLLTNISVSALGVVLAVAGCAGWFRGVFPREHEVVVPVRADELPAATERPVVDRLPVAQDRCAPGFLYGHIRYPRESRVAWPAVWRWRRWRARTA